MSPELLKTFYAAAGEYEIERNFVAHSSASSKAPMNLHPSYYAKVTPDHPAIMMAGSGKTVTYRQLDQASNLAAQLFRALGLKARDVVAVMIENCPEFLELYWATQRSGLFFVPISTQFVAGEVAYIVNDCKARVLIVSHTFDSIARELAPRLPRITIPLSIHGDIPGYRRFDAMAQEQPNHPLPDVVAGYELMYSSGTTGRPKGILKQYSPEPIDTGTMMFRRTVNLYHWTDETKYLSTAPLYHAIPLKFCASVGCAGGTTIIMEKFDTEEALDCLSRHRITHSQWVPTMFVRLLRLPSSVKQRYDGSVHRYALHSAAPCSPQIKHEMIKWWGPMLYEYYGAVEGNSMTAIDSTEWLARPGSVGRPVSGIPHIVDDHGTELPPGKPGTVYFDGPRFEYLNDPQKTQASRHLKGWSTVGDIGYVDEAGYLYLTDRRAFTIISGGVNIYPQEIENVLIGDARVVDAAVIGVPNDEFGEEVKAIVQLLDWRDASPELAEDLIRLCRSSLAGYKCPRSIEFDRNLPRQPNGKIQKNALRDRYWGDRKSRII